MSSIMVNKLEIILNHSYQLSDNIITSPLAKVKIVNNNTQVVENDGKLIIQNNYTDLKTIKNISKSFSVDANGLYRVKLHIWIPLFTPGGPGLKQKLSYPDSSMPINLSLLFNKRHIPFHLLDASGDCYIFLIDELIKLYTDDSISIIYTNKKLIN